ncbi:hypothetical protein CEP52_012238 [Fusarium oligoseptatum]|uniref:Uncharacterized protein n=1 Tax=Fusarium oligoseptatum TaxID=2604345 RepID=A0A428SZB9_9HYPO|nr:hypothetical protein CEP52_012238 [Fusarium oligoseptatum]
MLPPWGPSLSFPSVLLKLSQHAATLPGPLFRYRDPFKPQAGTIKVLRVTARLLDREPRHRRAIHFLANCTFDEELLEISKSRCKRLLSLAFDINA